MRRIVISSCVVVGLGLYGGGRITHAAPQMKAKLVKAKVTAAAPLYGNSESINEQELKIYDYFLASDPLEGRNLPSRGFDTAALYVASHLAEWGLKPGGSTEKTVGPLQPYFMPFELVSKQVTPADSKASVTSPAPAGGRGGRGGGGAAGPRTAEFEYGKDWTITGTGGRGGPPLDAFEVSGNVAFVGNGYVVNKTKTDPFEGLDVKGKIVVVAGLPAEIAAQQEQLTAGRGGGRGGAAPNAAAAPGAAGAPANPLGENCVDFLTPEEAAAKNGAVAVVTFANFQQLTAMANPNAAGGFGAGGGRGPGLNGPAYTAPKLQAKPACPSVPSVTAGLAMATSIFQGEKKSASQIFYAAGGKEKQESFALSADTKIKLKVAVKSEAGHAENVVGILEGSDPVKKNEYVVISAHLDHIGLSAAAAGGDTINNGADDDGSGSTALLALARTYAEGAAKGMRPARSIIFLWNAGEEKGLWGSQYFNEYPPVEIASVVANLNIDMIGRTKGPGFTDPDPTHVLVAPGEVLIVGPNISSDDLEKTLETVNDGYQKLVLNHFYDVTAPDKTHDNLGPQPRGQRIFYRSDHYNFAKMGIPIIFFTTGLHPDYHRVTDTADKIDFKEMLVVSKTVSAVAWVLANQAGRPKVNATVPEQLMKDMKSAKDQGWGKVTPVMPPLPNEPY
jgi:Zn-dependent M28 family amino/carboxypeptidase